MIVISDTSPLNYLVLVEQIEILPVLFDEVIVPASVAAELRHSGTPAVVRKWLEDAPDWVAIRAAASVDPVLHLGRGETEAICLAVELGASLLIVDDRLGRRAAQARGISVAGTVNVLEAAAERGLLDLREAFGRLRQTNFHVADAILARALAADAKRRGEIR